MKNLNILHLPPRYVPARNSSIKMDSLSPPRAFWWLEVRHMLVIKPGWF